MFIVGTKPHEDKERVRFGWKIKSNGQHFGAIKKVTRSTDNDSPIYHAIKRSLTYRLISHKD